MPPQRTLADALPALQAAEAKEIEALNVSEAVSEAAPPEVFIAPGKDLQQTYAAGLDVVIADFNRGKVTLQSVIGLLKYQAALLK